MRAVVAAQGHRRPGEDGVHLLLLEAFWPRRGRVRHHLALELDAPAHIERLEEVNVLLVVPGRDVADEMLAVLGVAILDAVLARLTLG